MLLTARATAQFDVEPFASLAEFATALERFDSVDPHATLRALFAAADEPTQVPLSVSAAQEPPALAPRPTEELALLSPEEIGDDQYQVPLAGGTRVGERAAHPEASPVVAAAAHVGGGVDRECSRRSYDCGRPAGAAQRRGSRAGDDRCPHPVAISRHADAIRCGAAADSSAQRGSSGRRRPSSPTLGARGSAAKRRGITSDWRCASRSAARDNRRGFRRRSEARATLLVDRGRSDADAVYSPSFAADGTALFFQAESPPAARSSVLSAAIAACFTSSRFLDDAAKNYHVKLSPDSRSVAFDSDRDGVRGVYVARADGTEVRRVSGRGYAAVRHAPDGRRLAFLRAEEDRPNVWNLWLLELDTGETTRLTSHRDRTGVGWRLVSRRPGGSRTATRII